MTLADLVTKVIAVINTLITVLSAGTVAFFLYGVANFIGNSDKPTAKQAGRTMILEGIMALVILLSVAGVVNLLATSVFGSLGGNSSQGITTGSSGGSSGTTGGSGSIALPANCRVSLFGYCIVSR